MCILPHSPFLHNPLEKSRERTGFQLPLFHKKKPIQPGIFPLSLAESPFPGGNLKKLYFFAGFYLTNWKKPGILNYTEDWKRFKFLFSQLPNKPFLS